MKNPMDQLLEVGPGAGALTKYFLELKNISFKAVELDEEKIRFLNDAFPQARDSFIHEDFLNMGIPFQGKFDIVGNFPYNISSQILFKILSWKEHVRLVTGMFQKEVAQRIAAGPGNKVYGVLTVLVQVFFDVEYLFEVHEKCFTPPPKVKSVYCG
jgi:16S rRNA (adenine1518-N6/adenine1519-N6)-dimethyltransferase